jgi:MFS family permease
MSNRISHDQAEKAYDGAFWLTYAANTLLMIAVSMMFRYSDFVMVLANNPQHEQILGWIVGVGATGSIAMRMFQGVAIDRFGAGLVWSGSLFAVVVSLYVHRFVDHVDTPMIYFVRILYATSVAGSFGASITFVSLRAPAGRIAELIGVLGSSGFLGMAIGPFLADSILRPGQVDLPHVQVLFQFAAGVTFIAMICAIIAGRRVIKRLRRRGSRPPAWWILKRYHPGAILLVGFGMGLGIGIPFVFVRPFADTLGVDGIRWFFVVYAMTAFAVRVFTRTLPDRWGVRPTVLLGMAFMATSMLSYLLATNAWLLMVPAFLGGVAHAFVFPAAVAGCSVSFPMRYRGLATTLMLTMFDVGSLVGPPAVGSLLQIARSASLPDYKVTFAVVTVVLALLTAIYAAAAKRKVCSTSGT